MHDPLLALAERLGGAPAELKETHISRVALAGEPGAGGVVLKQCKPVDFGFVDLRTREQRRAALQKEHAVNDRFAPGVYRGVRLLSPDDGADGEPVLEMLRLDKADTLEAKVKRGEATTADLDAVLDHLLPLFEQSDRGPEVAKWGAPAVIRQNLVENLDVLQAADDRTGGDRLAVPLRSVQLTYLSLNEPLFRARAAGGFIRDGHGDLRAEHVYLTVDGVKVLDGIAFCDRLRCIDVADEFAFLAYDLDTVERDWPWSATAFDGWDLLRRYRDRTGDPASHEMFAFYRSYRAAVRAKVTALSAPPPQEPRRADLEFIRPLSEAADCGLPWILVTFGGMSGCGKTTLAAEVAERLGCVHLRSDAVRKEFAGVTPTTPAPPEAYASETTEQVYRTLLTRTAEVVELTGVAVADATFVDPGRRRELSAAAAALAEMADDDYSGTDMASLFVWCECDDVVAERRIAQRAAAGEDASDATVEVRRKQVAETEPPTEAEFADQPSAALLRLDTDAQVETLADRVIDALRDLVRVARPFGVQ